ncbi:LOW QUALITY PROTEIN: hypothetical protein PanWU01x14_129050, partial [Parasponia andersonii]
NFRPFKTPSPSSSLSSSDHKPPPISNQVSIFEFCFFLLRFLKFSGCGFLRCFFFFLFFGLIVNFSGEQMVDQRRSSLI